MKTLIEELNLQLIHEFDQRLELTSFVSGNDLYRTKANTSNDKAWIYKTKEALALQKEIGWTIKSLPDSVLKSAKAYSMILDFVRNKSGWVYKNGNLKKIDLSNLVKVLEDGIKEGLGIDDSLCSELVLRKMVYESKNDLVFPVHVSIKFYG